METAVVVASDAGRLGEARRVRLLAERGRRLAVELATRLEGELREAAEAGMRAELARRLELKRRLLAVRKVTAETQRALHSGLRPAREPWARYGVATVLGLLLGIAAVALAPFAADASGARAAGEPAPVLRAGPGDGLRLALSYSLRLPAPR